MNKLLSVFVLLFALLFVQNINAQCDNSLIGNCVTGKDGLKYIKHFKIRFSKASSIETRSEGKFTVMLMKGNHYRFFACNDVNKPGKTVVELSSDFGEFGGNVNKETGVEYRAFDFVCTKTGPYYLKMFFKDGMEGCGVCIISLVMDK